MRRLVNVIARPFGHQNHHSSSSSFNNGSKECKYEKQIETFREGLKKYIHEDYSLFLQEMRQYFHRDAYNLYDIKFIKNILRNSMKRSPENQISSIVYSRKKRRLLDKLHLDEEYFGQIKEYMDEFYDQRNGEISGAFDDLCLKYELAANVIFDYLSRNDSEIYKLLHDNTYYSNMLHSRIGENDITPELLKQANKSIDSLLEYEDLLELPPHIIAKSGELEHVFFVSNLLRAYDRIHKATALEEEDLRLLAHYVERTDDIERAHAMILNKTKGKYLALVLT